MIAGFFKTVIALMLLFIFTGCDLLDKVRPHLLPYEKDYRAKIEEYFGPDAADKIFGFKEEEIKLPSIPKFEKDAKVVGKEIADKPYDFDEETLRKLTIAYIRDLYKATRDQDATEADIGKWYNVLTQGGTREGVYRGMVLDDYYGGLENYDNPISTNAADFAIYFASRFLGKGVNPDDFKESNFYKVKRVIVEETLDVMDALLTQSEEDYYNWYAAFSSEVAKVYPAIWEGSTLRKNPSGGYHKKWAQKMPYQMTKSEVIVKIHLIFNSVNK